MQINCSPFDEKFSIKGKSIKENSSKVEIEFKGNYYLINVDNGIFVNNKTDKKCDFLILNCDQSKVSYIELKGRNLADAAGQILNTHLILKNELKNFNIYEAIIVVRFVDKNELDSAKYIKLKRTFNKTNIKIKSRVYVYN